MEQPYEVYAAHHPAGAPIKMFTKGVQVEEVAKQQLINLSRMPFIHSHIAAMPDVHWGMGATVGSVIATKGAIIPAAVGVDIGCGMMAQRTTLVASDLPDNLFSIRSAIEASVPHGRTDEGGVNDRGAWGIIPDHINREFGTSVNNTVLRTQLYQICEKHPKIIRAAKRSRHHLGTLGTGNHFIEICLDEQQRVWIMLHSGSRGIGNRIGQHFIELAKQEMRRWYINLPDVDLAYLVDGSEYYNDYRQAVAWAQNYARLNREVMMIATLVALRAEIGIGFSTDAEAVNCHHNYVSEERHFGAQVHLTRKGAVSAREGELGIIPGSMGAKSYIVRGKGNRDSFMSCSHGAGRAMSRGDAKRKFTVADHEAATIGVECRKDVGVLDETPAAYKPIDDVMEAQRDLVEIVHTLKQVICVKG
jgi:tRNA-splicing ligase RtcB